MKLFFLNIVSVEIPVKTFRYNEIRFVFGDYIGADQDKVLVLPEIIIHFSLRPFTFFKSEVVLYKFYNQSAWYFQLFSIKRFIRLFKFFPLELTQLAAMYIVLQIFENAQNYKGI